MNKKDVNKMVSEEINRRIEKSLKVLFYIFFISVVAILIFQFGRFVYTISIDSILDERACELKLEGLVEDAYDVSCHANKDFFTLNNQKNIQCTCFYFDDKDYFGNYDKEGHWKKMKEFDIK